MTRSRRLTLDNSEHPYLDEKGRTDAERYLTDIQDGKIIAGVPMRQLADMMLPRFHEEYHGFHFDTQKSLRAVQFVEHFTCFPEGPKQGQPFLLQPFQRSALELGFGFVDEDGYRQFRQVIMMLGRKNGKSSMLAALMLYFLTSDNEPGAEVLCIANSERQSKRVFGHADLMRRKSPALRDRIRRGISQKSGTIGLNYDRNGSLLTSIAANVGTVDGYSASAYVYDELGATTDQGALIMGIEESVASRPQASGWVISSENYVRHNIWDAKIDHCKGILDGSVQDDRILPLLYCLDVGDDIFDPRVWPKANPGLTGAPGLYSYDGIKSLQYMEDRATSAKQLPQVKSSFMTKDLCLRATSYSSFLTQEECHNPETFEFNPETDRYGVLGFDLSSSGDLTGACCMYMRPGDNRIYEISHAWLPESQIEVVNGAKDLKERDGVPYSLWASGDHPWMTIVPGDKIDTHQAILGFIDMLAEKGMYIRYVGFDPWHVDDYLLRQLHMRVGESNCVKVAQNARTLSPIMKEHRIDLKAHRIINPSPVQEFCRSSVMAKEDAAGNVYPNKKELKPQNKIDLYMAELFAYKMLTDNLDSMKSIIGWYPPEENHQEI